MVVSVSSSDMAPTTPPNTIGTFNPSGFGFYESEVIQLDISDPSFYEINFDGISTISLSATEISNGGSETSTSVGFYDVFGNLLGSGQNGLSFDALEGGTYYFGITNPANGFFPNFQWGTITSFTDPVNVEVSTAALGDINCDGIIDLLDVVPFIEILVSGTYIAKADLNQDFVVDLEDVDPFVQLLVGQ